MGIIYSLSLKNNVCFATNSYFAKQLKVSNRTITSSISKLKSEGYIYVEMVDNNRKIYLTELWKNSSTHIENYFYDGQNYSYKIKYKLNYEIKYIFINFKYFKVFKVQKGSDK